MTRKINPMRLPNWWYISLTLSFGFGIYLISREITPIYQHSIGNLPDISIGWFFGILLIAIPTSFFIVNSISRGSHKLLHLSSKDDIVADLWAPVLVGTFEMILYPIALIGKAPDFIGFWLAVKVAGQWARWGTDSQDKKPENLNEGRRRFNSFLVGNAASIIAGTVIWIFLEKYALNR